MPQPINSFQLIWQEDAFQVIWCLCELLLVGIAVRLRRLDLRLARTDDVEALLPLDLKWKICLSSIHETKLSNLCSSSNQV